MGRAEALAGLRDGRENDLRLRLAIGTRRLVEAIVAIAARLRIFAEIAQQGLAAALRRLAIADQGVEPAMRAPFMVRRRVLVLDEQPAHADIAETEKHMRLGRPP